MNNLKERLYELRKTLDLSMEKFGNELGISKSAISGFEKGISNPSEQTLKLICKTFNVDPFWLREGIGDMFTAIPETIIDSLVDEFDLDSRDRFIIETYLQASESQRNAIKDFLLTLAEKSAKKNEE
ncbi:MAG: helix-turn-helix domain-containing protein [Beduini sp.]|uniref:helix-turn-helix domain-containing protein n=1 Tax=Beduini sp. TaxID=1922300 RepID=UPI0039A1558C